MSHNFSVFANSCVNVPVDPVSKMPKTAYERKAKRLPEQFSIDSTSTVGSETNNVDAENLKQFFKSIPDYNEINHLPKEEFYRTLKLLREKKNIMLTSTLDVADNVTCASQVTNKKTKDDNFPPITKRTKSSINGNLRKKYSTERKNSCTSTKNGFPAQRRNSRTSVKKDLDEGGSRVLSSLKKVDNDKPKRNQSACSITWDDEKLEKDEVDRKFDQIFDSNKYDSGFDAKALDDEFKTRSMPSSPLRNRRILSPVRRKSITVPKPFRMTLRDEDNRILSELKSLQKSFSADMLDQKFNQKRFRARPVPIESRIPLYDKIMEDQAMRRAISKINSEADLRAKMKPFKFTKREENGVLGGGVCAHVMPKPRRRKRFRARPVPRNLFSNYFFEKKKEDDFFRAMNRRIRSEEMLKLASLPGSMAARMERSRLSTPAAHSDLPVDPSPPLPSDASSDRKVTSSPLKERRKKEKGEFITTSPQPFRLSTAERAAKKMADLTKKIYQDSKSSSADASIRPRAYSAFDLRAHAAGRSNLAALLRVETVRQRFEEEATRKLLERQRQTEMRARDRLLRTNPSWRLVKNNYQEDIAMRLQTRRDEERMRREEFLHEMELMYGRVQQQPWMFERYYAPRPHVIADSLQLSPRKLRKKKSSNTITPMRSRKTSLNDCEGYDGNVMRYLERLDKESKVFSDSEAAGDVNSDLVK